MEKLRNLLSPGHSKDDEVMYNTPEKDDTAGATGKVSGQGSHFGSSSAAQEESTADTGLTSASDPLNTSAQPTTLENASASASASAERQTLPTSAETPATTARDETGSAALGETSTDSTAYQKPETSTVGRDTTEAAGSAGALTAATLAFRKAEERKASGGAMPGGYPSPDSSNPTADSYTEPQRKPSIASKVLGVFGLGKEKSAEEDASVVDTTSSKTSAGPPAHHRKESIPTTAYPSGTFEAPRAINAPVGGTERSAETSTSGRDAATAGTTAGAAGLAGAAAHEGKVDQFANQPYSSRGKQPLETTGESAAGTSAVGSAMSGHALEEKRMDEPATTTQSDVPYRAKSTPQPYSVDPTASDGKSHTGRDAALGGVGAAGAAGLAGYESEKNREAEPATTDQSDIPYRAESTPYNAAATAPTAETSHTEQPTTTTDDGHLGRDAAIGGAAGVGAAGLAEEDHRRREAERREKEYMKQQEAAQKEREKQQEAAMKQREKEEAAAAKQAEKEEKAHEKAIAKEEKAREKEEKKAIKEHDKEEKKAAKEAEKEQKAVDKQAAKEEKERREHEAEIGAAGVGAATVGTGAYEAEKHHHEDAGTEPTRDAGMDQTPGTTAGTAPLAGTGADSAVPVEESSAEPSTGHPLADTAAGAGAAGKAAQQLDKHDESTTTSEPTELPGLAATDAADREANGRTSTTAPLSSSTGEPTSVDRGGTSAAAVYAADKEAEAEGQTVPKDHHLELPPGLSRLEAADAIDRMVYGGGKKKPSFFRRIFRSRKNKDTGDDEQYETDEEYEGEEQGTHGQATTTT